MFQMSGNIWLRSHRNSLFYNTVKANKYVEAKIFDRLLRDAT
jgi:hypothetical protein